MPKYIVTGGAGFIGSHLCESLLQKGYTVYCLDNLITGNRENIAHLSDSGNFHFVEIDVTSEIPLAIKANFSGLSGIYHLASPASPPFYKKYSIETLLVNSAGTKNMLDLARLTGASFLYTSTSEVYGNPLVHPQKETYFGNVNPVGVRACYDEAKRFGEALIMEYIRKFDVNARIVRIFNTYGPRMQSDDGRVVVNFVNQALAGRNLVMYGDGSFTRSFCYISDMVRGLILALESPKARGEVINLGFPREHTIKEIARIIIELTKSESKITVGTPQEDDPARRRPDIGKAKKILGWVPETELEQGLKKTIEYFSQK